jgi:hypothetical protein
VPRDFDWDQKPEEPEDDGDAEEMTARESYNTGVIKTLQAILMMVGRGATTAEIGKTAQTTIERIQKEMDEDAQLQRRSQSSDQG